MRGKITKITVWICLAALLIGMFPATAVAADNPVYTGAQGSVDMDRGGMDTDVSCMTFNVLHYISGSVQNYGSGDYATRRNYAVSLIRAYDPDIIGMQEAGNDSNHTENWPADLEADLGDTYTPILLTDQTSQVSQMYITCGLVIWYRTSRFTLLDSGAECYWSYSNNCSETSKDRWYQWAKLYDNAEGKTVFVFNTHLSTNHSPSVCSTCTTSAAGATVGRQQRTNELVTLANQIHTLSQNYPCFVTGDFNTTMADSLAYESDTARYQLLAMSASPHAYLQSALVTSDLQVTSQGSSAIDHVFINTNYLRARKLVGIQESVNGYIGSDHFPYIAYCDYRAAADIGPGDYDETARTYTDTTDSNQYTFTVTPTAGFTYKIFKDTGVQTGNTIWSVKDTSKYEIRFYDPSGALYSTVDATIYATSAVKPTLTSTGINQYFANHAYHVIAQGTSVTVTPTCTGSNTAAIYRDDACTDLVSGGAITNVTGGRSVYYLKHNVFKSDGTLNYSEVFPLYVYKETAPAHSAMALYVDRNIGDATGTVAFWDGTDVRLAEGQVTGFDSLSDAQPTVNTADGYSIYLAPGEYEGNAKSFTKSFSLYGANWDVSPNTRVVEGTWSMADRRAETVIDGQLLISLYGNTVTTKSIAVQGVTFTGQAQQGSIYVIENRGGTGSTYWEANSAYEIELDIRNNIFLGWSTQSSSADINLNCASQKCGVIAGNYFGREVGRTVSNDTAAYPLTYDCAIYGRNINGLMIDSNRFVNYDKDFISLTAEIGYGTTLPGYAVYTVQDNRFENCVSTLNRICNITSATLADVKYLGNYFIRCGYGTGAVFVDATETTGTTTNYHYCDLTVLGNKFYECERAFGIFRNGTSLNGYFNVMGITLSQNVFHNPCERAMQPKNGYSAGTAAENYTYSQQSYGCSTIYFRIANTSQSVNGVATAWDLSHNYFYSARLADDYANPYHPSLYINSYMKEWTNGTVSAEYECLNFTFEDAFFPYYTNHGCTNASSTDDVSTKPVTAAVSTVPGITAAGYDGAYDGQGHSITVTVPEGAFVSYSYDDPAAAGYKSYSAANPTFTEPGTYTVTYRVIAPGCKATYGSAAVTITETEPEMSYAGASLSLAGDIGLNFYVNLDETLRADPETRMVFTYGGKTQTVYLADTYEDTNGTVFTCKLWATEMAKTVTAQLYYSGGAVGTGLDYSVKAYCSSIFAFIENNPQYASSLATTGTLLKAMLNYGTAAQVMFTQNTAAEYANADLPEADKILDGDYDYDAYAHSVSGAEEGIATAGASLILDSTTTIRYFFRLTGSKTIDEYTFVVNGREAEPVLDSQTGCYYVDLVGVISSNLDVMYTAQVGGLTITYGAMSYVRMVKLNTGADAQLVALADALYAYSRAADAYVS